MRSKWRRISERGARSCGFLRKWSVAGNRKNQSPVIRFVPVLKTLFLCLFIGGSGVGYVWQRNQIYELSRTGARLWDGSTRTVTPLGNGSS